MTGGPVGPAARAVGPPAKIIAEQYAATFGGGSSASDPAASRRRAAKTSTLIPEGAPSVPGEGNGHDCR